jgi:hypothetical protein
MELGYLGVNNKFGILNNTEKAVSLQLPSNRDNGEIDLQQKVY